jgi:hypothetical protein
LDPEAKRIVLKVQILEDEKRGKRRPLGFALQPISTHDEINIGELKMEDCGDD